MQAHDIGDKLKATGKLTVVHTNSFGEIVKQFEVPNLVVTTGKNYIASRMKDATATAMTHMAIGTGTGTPAAGDTTLGTETGRVSLSNTVVSTNTVTYTATFPAGTGSGAITEAGVLNASTAGTMLCRTTFPVVTKQVGDTIAITWVVTVS
jgi:hypothetical protein